MQKKSSAFMMVIAIYSPDERYDPTYVANYANIYVLDAIKRIPGAGPERPSSATPDYAMRLWLKPDRMAAPGRHGDRRPAGRGGAEPAVRRRPHRPSPTGDAGASRSFAVTTSGR